MNSKMVDSISTVCPFDEYTGSPETSLRLIAEVGYTHVHWAHQLFTDFLYSDSEISQIRCWLNDFGLRMCDLHASHGIEKRYCSAREYERQAGVELVANRIRMTAALNGSVIVLHLTDYESSDSFFDTIRRSLDELQPIATDCNVRIAIENGSCPFEYIEKVLGMYDPGYIGLCYDSGHGNLFNGGQGLQDLERLKERLISIHLHDNTGYGEDIHLIPFHKRGTIDWNRLADIIASSPYEGPITCEANGRMSGFYDPVTFLPQALATCRKFRKMIEDRRQ